MCGQLGVLKFAIEILRMSEITQDPHLGVSEKFFRPRSLDRRKTPFVLNLNLNQMGLMDSFNS